MKVIAAAGRERFIVEMTQDEIVKAAGFSSAYGGDWEKRNGGRDVKVGTEVKVEAAYTFHSQISYHQDKAKSAAGILKALAEMLENALPDVVIPPVEEAPEGGEA
jgi:hypothetical protein